MSPGPQLCRFRQLWLTVARLFAVASLACTWPATGQIVIADGFDSGSFAPGWGLSAGVALPATGGASGTPRFARLSPYSAGTGRELGARLDAVAPDGARDFTVDFAFRIQSSANRQFNLHISTSAAGMSSAAAALNLRYQSGWAAYDGSAWQPIPGLGAVTAGSWHRARLSGQGWGSAGARFSMELSDADGTNITNLATNLAWFQSGNPAANPARYFLFSTIYGNNPGFDIDEVTAAVTAIPPRVSNAIVNISGTYPHLAVFSQEGEIGIGAVAAWADRLWFVTYPPHNPTGGSDKLWTLDRNLTLTARPESVGGTHANRMVHRESQQLVIGPYFVDTNAQVRVVPPNLMPGRLTANARHLTDPTNLICFATMEEGFYSVDVNSLAVTTLKPDAQSQTSGPGLILPGNHGKGCYSGQGRLVYANNGDTGWTPGSDFSGFNQPAGLLAELAGSDFTNGWSTVERKNFTEVTGPGGIYGNASASDPLWALGWDKRSVLLKLLDDGTWRNFRLPKGSYTHDSFQGWYTEWPRIREIVEGKLLMHMHGLFYYFPRSFSAANTAGITPICTYLKMPVDYCWWNGQLVMGRDDASTTGGNIWAGQSHSAPWFGQMSDLEQWGSPAGFGGPWKEDDVTANVPSDPFLVRGFLRRVLHLKHNSAATVNFTLKHDPDGLGHWANLTTVSVGPQGYAWCLLPPALATTWLRIVPDQNAIGVTAYLHLANPPTAPAPALFAGLAEANATNCFSDGILRPQTGDARTLQFAANNVASNGALTTAYYEIDGALQLRCTTNASAENTLRTTYPLTSLGFLQDAASVVFVSGSQRFRLPRSSGAFDQPFASGWPRGVREVVTERQLFQAHGTFYELPLSGSGGFRRVRPVATHGKHISDFASWRGLLALAGVTAGATNDGHVIRSDGSQAALWFGNVDDLWRLGAPAGVGGPWKDTAVAAGAASDPYLMYGYEHKVLELSHKSPAPVTFIVEVDFAADNTWSEYARFNVPPGQTLKHQFQDGYSAHWVRLKTDTTTSATAIFAYGPAAPQISGAALQPDGRLRLTLIGSPGQAYTILTSTNLAVPRPQWSTLGTGTFTAGLTTHDDLTPAQLQNRFYLIAIP